MLSNELVSFAVPKWISQDKKKVNKQWSQLLLFGFAGHSASKQTALFTELITDFQIFNALLSKNQG